MRASVPRGTERARSATQKCDFSNSAPLASPPSVIQPRPYFGSRARAIAVALLAAAAALLASAEAARAGPVPNFPVVTPPAGCECPDYLVGITAGPDGNIWFTESLGNRIGRIT